MANLFKRVASAMMKDETSDSTPCSKSIKLDDSNENEAVSSEVHNPKPDVSRGNRSTQSVVVPSVHDVNGKEEDDDLFGELNEPTERVIQKVSEMKIGEIYQLVDIYSMQIEDRLAVVGGFQLDEEPVIYVWMPTSLVRNYDAKKVLDLKAKISNGKKGYAVYRGMKATKYNTSSYDIVWVQKNQN
ncbi:Early transcription factor 70 kDa subunit [Frankliniella fusca]|uniref:Early transcription factor 70 kDa subunit n=1 Tax=Frankliniella fusca TaxID=407009 RepID=A0AAE1LJY1_9NEOP|nr:Early transcription factor 70 kDa subunit [Frankliniella fusca]KAK3920857.1 Early transcription factor 70 kDa subunit [Frankliniella fusca]